MLTGKIYPENLAKLSKEDMEKILVALLGHVNRSLTYNTGPVELANRVLTELIEADLLEMESGGGCGSCGSCSTPPKQQRVKKEGKIIRFPTPN